MDVGIWVTLLAFALLVGCMLLSAGWRIRLARRRELARDALRASHTGAATGLDWIAVQVSRPAWYRRLRSGHEAGGWLVIDAQAGSVRLLAQCGDDIIDRSWPLTQTRVQPRSLNSRLLPGFLIGGEPLLLAADAGANEVRSWRLTTDLLQRLALTGLPAHYTFRIGSNRWSLACSVIFFALILYGMIESVAQPYLALMRPPALERAQWLLPLLALLAVPVLRRARVPDVTAWTLAVLLGIALLNALPKAFQRVDTLTTTGAFTEQPYRLEAGGRFVPLADGLPPMRLRGPLQALARGEPGTQLRFPLRRGGLGIWQLDEGPLRERLRAGTPAAR